LVPFGNKDYSFDAHQTVGARAPREDTVTTDKEDDEVNADHHVGEDRPPVGHNAVVHHSVPVLSSEDLQKKRDRADTQGERSVIDTLLHNGGFRAFTAGWLCVIIFM